MANTCGGDDNLFDYVCEGVDEKYVSLARSRLFKKSLTININIQIFIRKNVNCHHPSKEFKHSPMLSNYHKYSVESLFRALRVPLAFVVQSD